MSDQMFFSDNDAFTASISLHFDNVTVPRNMAKPYWKRIGWGTVNHTPTRRQIRLCDRTGHPRNALVRRNRIASCARCGRVVP